MCVSVGVKPLRHVGPAPLQGGAVPSRRFCYTPAARDSLAVAFFVCAGWARMACSWVSGQGRRVAAVSWVKVAASRPDGNRKAGFRAGDFRDVSICPIFWSYLPHISGRLFFIFVAQELKPCLWDLRTKKSGAHACGVRNERNEQYEKTYPVVCCVAVVSMPLQGTGAI